MTNMIDKKTIIISYTEHELPFVVDTLSRQLEECCVITLTGDLGAGKTTFVQELLSCWGVLRSEITSPTFTYLNIYTGYNELRFYHFDLYRLTTLDAFLYAGFDEYLYQPNSIAFIEWPEPIMSLLDRKVAHCMFEHSTQENTRVLRVTF
jgi:tRNA threonylcarbamoyladenosine biosynthesis protein TsaE